MDTKINEIEVNGIKYVPKDSAFNTAAVNDGGFQYVVVRADRAGVFAGFLKEKKDTEVTLVNVRRLWYWDGAASCSQLAQSGVSKPQNCKFTAPNEEIIIKNWIEIIPATAAAQKSIQGVAEWTA